MGNRVRRNYSKALEHPIEHAEGNGCHDTEAIVTSAVENSDLKSTHISQVMQSQVRPLIDAVDALRSLGIQRDLPVPTIAVFGDQSSGKSSVLEALSGIPFPRGSGLVTRCATEIRMKRGLQWQAVAFDSLHGREDAQNLGSVEALGEHIETLTGTLCGGGTFSSERIIIELQAPDVPDLTVTDLPGIVRTRTEGQAEDVIEQVDSLLNKYMEQERTILLVVVPTTQDVATVEVLERAAQFDPEGHRTIGVLTKPDLINPGAEEEAVSVLLNKTKPLALGYIMVKNRSQRDINEGMTVAQASAAEARWFQQSPVFSRLDPELFGAQNLAALLTVILVNRIKVFLPVMREEIDKQLITANSELAGLGESIADSLPEKIRVLGALTSDYTAVLSNRAKGINTDIVADSRSAPLYTSVVAAFENFQSDVTATYPTEDYDYVQRIMRELRLFRTDELRCFLSSQYFASKTAEILRAWVPMSHELLHTVASLISKDSVSLASRTLHRFPGLHGEVLSRTTEELEACTADVLHKLDELGQQEMSAPFTMNASLLQDLDSKQFEGLKAQLASIVWEGDATALRAQVEAFFRRITAYGTDEMQLAQAEKMIDLLQVYWKVASERYIDNVCNLVRYDLLHRVPVNVKVHSNAMLGDHSLIERVMQEAEGVRRQRALLQDKVKRLSSAKIVISKV